MLCINRFHSGHIGPKYNYTYNFYDEGGEENRGISLLDGSFSHSSCYETYESGADCIVQKWNMLCN